MVFCESGGGSHCNGKEVGDVAAQIHQESPSYAFI